MKLTLIKIIHTLIWCLFNLILFYLAYSAINNRLSKWIWIGVAIIILEGIVLLIYKNKCPLTVVARRYSDSKKDNFDIYLPEWLARYNKVIYTSLFIIILCGLIFRMANK